MHSTWISLLGGVLCSALQAQTAADWPSYNRDPGGTRYSPLTQITPKNVASLTQAWSYRLLADAPAAAKGKGGAGGGNSEATPIVGNGVMYLPAANRIVALDPESGKELWRYEPTGGAPSRRGGAYSAGDRTTPAPSML